MADDTCTVERRTTVAAPPEEVDSSIGPDFEKGFARLDAHVSS